MKKADGYYCDICKVGIHETNLVIRKVDNIEYHYHSMCLKEKESLLKKVISLENEKIKILESRILSIAFQFTIIASLVGLIIFSMLRNRGML